MVEVTAIAGQIAGKIFSGILIFGIVVVVILVLGGTMYYFLIYKRKFDIDVKMTSKRAGDRDYIIFDQAAILTDRKTKAKYIKLWSSKIELKLPSFNILQRTNKGDYLEIFREGENKFYYMTPPFISRKYGIKADGRLYPMAEQSTKLIDPEMDYWVAKRKSMNKGMFDQEQVWMKILPYVPYILGGAFTIFILYILMSRLPAILAQLQELTSELNRRNVAEVTTGIWQSLI